MDTEYVAVQVGLRPFLVPDEISLEREVGQYIGGALAKMLEEPLSQPRLSRIHGLPRDHVPVVHAHLRCKDQRLEAYNRRLISYKPVEGHVQRDKAGGDLAHHLDYLLASLDGLLVDDAARIT